MATRLERTFAYYNRKYFGGLLTPIAVKWSETLDPDVLGTFEGDVIKLNAKFKSLGQIWRLTLIHEMAHLKVQDHPDEIKAKSYNARTHSSVWQKEMKRLANSGAFKLLW